MPKDADKPASRHYAHRTQAGLPGAWQAAVIAALSALALGYWMRPSADTAPADAETSVSRMAEIAPGEIPAALGTLSESSDDREQLRARDACGRRLAWVTIMRSPGQPPGRLRLQSGNYFSPAFDLGEAPVRVALPYPAPYATGHGTITVLGTTTGATVALTPPWHVPAEDGAHSREVTWSPMAASGANCPGADN